MYGGSAERHPMGNALQLAKLAIGKKESPGIRPITVGNVWRRLLEKLHYGSSIKKANDDGVFLPTQVGAGGVRDAIDATQHALNDFCFQVESDSATDWIGLKIDGSNAYNNINRFEMLKRAQLLNPGSLTFDLNCYQADSALYVCDTEGVVILLSAEGFQQGGPKSGYNFCLGLQPLIDSIKAKFPDIPFNIWYQDDGTLVGPRAAMIEVIQHILEFGPSCGFFMNLRIREIKRIR